MTLKNVAINVLIFRVLSSFKVENNQKLWFLEGFLKYICWKNKIQMADFHAKALACDNKCLCPDERRCSTCFEVYIYMVMGTGLWGLAELTVIANLDYEYGSVSRPQMNLGYHQPN